MSLKFLGKDPNDSGIKWSEDQVQMYIVQEARRAGYFVSASLEKGKRTKANGARNKVMGMIAGMPDLNFWLYGGKIVPIELKITKGILSEDQEKIHPKLISLGFMVFTVVAKSPEDGWIKTHNIIRSLKHANY